MQSDEIEDDWQTADGAGSESSKKPTFDCAVNRLIDGGNVRNGAT